MSICFPSQVKATRTRNRCASESKQSIAVSAPTACADTLDLETPNFRQSAEVTPGVNEFQQPGGLHFWQLRMPWLASALADARDGCGLQAIVYDEAEHMQLSNNKYSNYPKSDFDQPFLVNTHGMSLEQAYERSSGGARRSGWNITRGRCA